jgi:DNA-binding transcriptional regulator YdaS (Cro superfamily)
VWKNIFRPLLTPVNSLYTVSAMHKGLRKACDKAGGVTALANKLGITRAAIYHWDKVPAERVVEIEKLTGVAREELRPDLFRKREPKLAELGAAE